MALTAGKFIETNGAPASGVQAMQSSTIGPPDLWDYGIFDYADLATQTTAIAVPGTNTLTTITNDGLGANTFSVPPQSGVTDVWDTATDQFDFSELAIGDMVDIRLDVEVTTSVANQVFDIVLEAGQGGGVPFEIPWVHRYVKTAGVNPVNIFNGIYMKSSNAIDNPAQFKIKSPSACTVVVNGWYCKVVKKGF